MRVNYLYEIEEDCHHENDFEHMLRLSKGATVAIEMTGSDEDHGIYASSYHQVIKYFAEQISKDRLETLFVLIEITDRPGFAGPMTAAMQEYLHIIEIREGYGNRKQALDYLRALTGRSMFGATEDEMEKLLPRQKENSASQVNEVYNK